MRAERQRKHTQATARFTLHCYQQPQRTHFLDLGDPAKTYTLITGEDSDIQETDRITDEDSIKYTVKGVRKVRLLSSSHIEATVVELNS